MTRADYRRVAAAIRNLSLEAYGDRARQQRAYIAAAIATALTPTNPLFDRARFIDAAVDGPELPDEVEEHLTVDGHMYVHVAACPCPAMVLATAKHAEDAEPRIIGYTAFECERDMRRMTNGERGCSNPEEHAS